MFHDKAMIETAENELFSLGEGHIGYVRIMRDDELRSLPAEIGFEEAWGVYSATGDTLAVCDSQAAAWSYFADHQLVPVSVH
jgi:hypothetical protein